MVAAPLLTFAVTFEPIVKPPEAMTFNVPTAWLSTVCPDPLIELAPILRVFECTMTLSLASMISSPLLWTFTTLLAASKMILFFLVLSTRTMRSAPSLSSKIMRCPPRDLMSLVLFFPVVLFSTGFCC